MTSQVHHGDRTGRYVAAVCAALLLLSALLAASAVHGKCATYDEPDGLVQGWLQLHLRDFRMELGHPPLWDEWPALAVGRESLHPDLDGPVWRNIPRSLEEVTPFAVQTLYERSDHHADELLFRARLMMLVPGIALGALLAWWAWKLAGGVAAIAATALFALDPNFLAHLPLVKNDVFASLTFLATAFCVWRLGQKATPARIAAAGLTIGMALCIKLTALLLAAASVAALFARVFLPEPWEILGRTAKRISQKLLGAMALTLICAALSVLVIWASYDFRFAVSPDSAIHADTDRLAGWTIYRAVAARHPGRAPSEQELRAEPTPLTVRLALMARERRVLPEGWLNAVVSIASGLSGRESFLMGQFNRTGWWYYFPLMIWWKTPVASLITFALAGGVLLREAVRRRPTIGEVWTSIAIALPAVVYLGTTLLQHVDIGIRHALPLFPFAYLACGVGLAVPAKLHAKFFQPAAFVLTVGLAVETLTSFPNFIPFFNAFAGGSRGGVRLLSDSNIDWGQDLPLLAKWREDQKNGPLYLCYFGTAPPSYYGLHCPLLAGSYPVVEFPEQARPAPDSGVLAISATQLQGTYLSPALRSVYRPFLRQKPLAVLGGSIYLFDIAGDRSSPSFADRMRASSTSK